MLSRGELELPKTRGFLGTADDSRPNVDRVSVTSNGSRTARVRAGQSWDEGTVCEPLADGRERGWTAHPTMSDVGNSQGATAPPEETPAPEAAAPAEAAESAGGDTAPAPAESTEPTAEGDTAVPVTSPAADAPTENAAPAETPSTDAPTEGAPEVPATGESAEEGTVGGDAAPEEGATASPDAEAAAAPTEGAAPTSGGETAADSAQGGQPEDRASPGEAETGGEGSAPAAEGSAAVAAESDAAAPTEQAAAATKATAPAPVSPVSPTRARDYDPAKLRERRTNTTRGFIPPGSIELAHSFGFETQKRNNLQRVGEKTLLAAAGNSVLMLDLDTMEQRFLPGIDPGGIGAITVHPAGTHFAVGERGVNPNVYIYEYPSLTLARVLENGTERAFSDMRFSNDGKMLATVGGMPDYLLHIWDWEAEQVLLRAKAFSQDVYNVSFSPRFDGTLYTSGTGHIRFWKMADTFTGLKLQGEIGKFGAIELSDISAYLELPDGKVLSGSEAGNLLLWDGGLVKVEIRTSAGPCHAGMVEVLFMHEGEVVSGGADGVLRFWAFAQIDVAEPVDDEPVCVIDPLREVHVAADPAAPADPPVRIRTMHVDPAGAHKEWLVQDDAGGLWRCAYGAGLKSQRLAAFHAGRVAGCPPPPPLPY